MNEYPKALSYSDWLNKYIYVLPENKVLKFLYLPFYLAGLAFVLVTIVGGFIFPIIFAPFYGVYLLSYSSLKEKTLQKEFILVIDENTIKKTKLKDIDTPIKEGYVFLGWKLEDDNFAYKLWKLTPGTKLVAGWKEKNESQSNYKTGFYLKLSGVSMGNRQQNIKKIKVNDELVYIREPNNPYDKNAILIKTKDGLELGYIPKKNNTQLATNMDKGIKYRITVSTVTGSGVKYRGVNIHILQEGQTQSITQEKPKSTRKSFYPDDFDFPDLMDMYDPPIDNVGIDLYDPYDSFDLHDSYDQYDDFNDGGYDPSDFDPF